MTLRYYAESTVFYDLNKHFYLLLRKRLMLIKSTLL